MNQGTMKYVLENCANGAESALKAQEGGADRVELCAGIPEGGTTPSLGEMRLARRLLTHTTAWCSEPCKATEASTWLPCTD